MGEEEDLDSKQIREVPITEIKAIEKNRGELIKTRDQIRDYVEPPLTAACQYLWDMNVQTLASSANSKDVGYEAYVIIDFNSLSENNRTVGKEVGDYLENNDGKPAIKINVPVSAQTTAAEIKEKFLDVAEMFKKQKAVWIPSYSIQDLRKIYALDPNDERYGADDFKDLGLHYDLEGKRFYLSEEHFQKAKEEIID
jgi:hypothetical protein